MEAQRKHMVIPWGKKLFFLEMWVMRKILTGAAKFYFFNQFSRDILFSSLVSLFLSFDFVFACFFFEIKIYILIYIQLCRQVSDKKITIRLIFGKKTTFLTLNLKQNS